MTEREFIVAARLMGVVPVINYHYRVPLRNKYRMLTIFLRDGSVDLDTDYNRVWLSKPYETALRIIRQEVYRDA